MVRRLPNGDAPRGSRRWFTEDLERQRLMRTKHGQNPEDVKRLSRLAGEGRGCAMSAVLALGAALRLVGRA